MSGDPHDYVYLDQSYPQPQPQPRRKRLRRLRIPDEEWVAVPIQEAPVGHGGSLRTRVVVNNVEVELRLVDVDDHQPVSPTQAEQRSLQPAPLLRVRGHTYRLVARRVP